MASPQTTLSGRPSPHTTLSVGSAVPHASLPMGAPHTTCVQSDPKQSSPHTTLSEWASPHTTLPPCASPHTTLSVPDSPHTTLSAVSSLHTTLMASLHTTLSGLAAPQMTSAPPGVCVSPHTTLVAHALTPGSGTPPVTR